MSLLIAKDLQLSFGPKAILSGANFTLGPSDRVGLLGPNGTGKSTLLKVLKGEVALDSGALVFRRGVTLGHLPQDLAALPQGRLIEAVLSMVPGRDALDGSLRSTEAELAQATDSEEQLELAQRLADLHERADHFEAHFGRHRAEAILAGLGFTGDDCERPTSVLSGGWRMRAALAGLLLMDADLLLLDEPTNHLDLPTLAWFDGFLKRSKKAMVLISHDRTFLNRHIGRVLSLEVEGLRGYAGDCEDYMRLRAEEVEQLLNRADRQAARRAEMEAFINRFRAKASKARQVQSRVKLLEKEEIIEVRKERASVSFEFPTVAVSGKEVATFKGVRKAFGSRVVYDGVDATLWRGQRVAVVGVNGAGKTTLLKLLAAELEPDAGQIVLGQKVELGYFAQHHAETLDLKRSILEEMCAWVPERSTVEVRSVLGAFLFSGGEVDKRIGVLSGGERARVALARLLLRPANLLVMDEPTNHLDFDASEALIDALEDYGGTLIFVSHNHSFLNRLATHVWDVRDHQVVPFPGNLSEYMHHLELAAEARFKSASPAEAQVAGSGESQKDRRRREAEARQERNRALGPLKKRLTVLEARIAELEALQKTREQQLEDPAFAADYARARPVMEAHRADAAALEAALHEWEEAQRSFEAASREDGAV